MTQYWKRPQGTWREDPRVAVNGRYTYWLSRRPIPGGVVSENFEMRERFHENPRGSSSGLRERLHGSWALQRRLNSLLRAYLFWGL